MDAISYDLMISNRNEEVEKTVIKEQSRLFNFIRKYVGNIEDTKDILQDVFYQFVAGYDDIRAAESTTSWLYTVARNKVTDLFRKKKPVPISEQQFLISSEESGEMLTIEDLLPDRKLLPDDEYFNKILWEEIMDALDELPYPQKDVFIKNEFEGKSFKEISEMTGEPINTLLSRKRYAILYLRERLREFFNEL